MNENAVVHPYVHSCIHNTYIHITHVYMLKYYIHILMHACIHTYIATYKPFYVLYIHALQGIKDRDELVFTEVRAKRRIPILMLQGGGFQVNIYKFFI